MPCDEAIRLKAEYDAALRRWGRTLFSPQLGLESTFRVEAEQVRLVAYEARNETASRLVTHQRGCPLCRREKVKLVKDKSI